MIAAPAGTERAPSRDAKCSLAATERGPNNGTALRSDSSRVGGSTTESMVSKRRHASRVATMMKEPVAISAPRTPSAATSGGEEGEGDGGIRPGRDERDRKPPEDEPDAERNGEPTTCERRRDKRTEKAAGSNCGDQVTDPRAVDLEKAKCDHDDEHVQRPAHEGLRADERHDRPRIRIAQDSPEPGHEGVSGPVRVRRRRQD